jgi:predicted transposase YdaD
MHEYDVALKRILTRPGSALLYALTGASELRWLNVELPKVNNLRVDLLGARPDGELVHLEFQSRNRKDLLFRMGEYRFAIARRYGRLPKQIVLYVGEKPLRMKSSIKDEDTTYRFHLVDIRDLDGETLLASKKPGDNVVALLTRLGDQPGIMRQIERRISRRSIAEREEAQAELSILAGLRKPSSEINREARNMPITEDIMKNEIVAPFIRRKVEQGRAEGRAEGRAAGQAEGLAAGLAEGQRTVLLSQMEKRFGRVPPAVRKRLARLNSEELTATSLRLLDAQRIDDLFIR